MATLIVTNTNDAGAGSLRQAVLDANASVGVADLIQFSGSIAGQVITLTTGELALTDDVTIDGDTNGDNKADIGISGNNASRIFNQTGYGTDVDLLSMSLTFGLGNTGGAIKVDGGTLNILDSTIANSNGGYAGGGIYASNTLFTMTNSLVVNNLTTGYTSYGGGIRSLNSTTTLTNSTVTGNIANSSEPPPIGGSAGGGISNIGGVLTLLNSTVTGNEADYGGGISSGSTLSIINSVVTGTVSGTVTTFDHSVFASTAADVGLGILGLHGGTTATFDIISPTSVLINAGSNTAAAGILTDANGNARISAGTVDIGATEYSRFIVTNLNDTGAGSLRAALALADATSVADEIVFSVGLNGTILTASTLTLSNEVTINGDTNDDGDPDIIIGSNGTYHSGINVQAGATVALTSLGISGFTTQTGASAIQNNGTLTLNYAVLSGNTVTGSAYTSTGNGAGGATIINASTGILSLHQSVFSSNSARGGDTGSLFDVGGHASSSVLNLGSLSTSITAIIGGTARGGYADDKGGSAAVGILNLSSAFGTISNQSPGSATPGATNGSPGQASTTNLNLGGTMVLTATPMGTDAGDIVSGIGGIFYGLGGSDVLSGNQDSTLFGGAGNDTLTANRNAAVRGGLGNDIVRNTYLGSGGYTDGGIWDGGAGIDTFDASLATGSYFGGGLSLNLSNNYSNFNGTVSNFENIIGTNNAAWVDVLTGSAGNNIIQGFGGSDILDGGSGNDTLDYSEKTGTITLALNGATAVLQQLNGVNEDVISNFENIIGGSGNDVLNGDANINTLNGNAGDDIITGGVGADILNGGTNTAVGDTLSYAGSAAGVTVNIALNTTSGGDAALDVISNFENVIGSSFVDVLTGTTGDNLLRGGAGADTLNGGTNTAVGDTLSYAGSAAGVTVNIALNTTSGGDAALDVISNFENIIGSSFIDVLTGTTGDNLLRGGAGADTLNGGANTVVGDTLSYEGSAAFVVVNFALNTASGGDATGDIISNFENVTGSSQGDQLTGNTGANALKGGAGDDVLSGGAGADSLDGGGNNDTADYRTSTGTNISVNLLLDTASGGHAAGDTLDGIENLFGSLLQRDILIGDTGSNILKGFGGIDSLQGGDGDDFIEGGADGDAINGGAGVNDWASYRDSNTGQVSINLLTNTYSGGDAQGDTLFFIENLEGSLTRRDILIGNIVANRIVGNGGVDTIQGGDGNDFIDGGTGGDSLNAGAGIDTLSYEKSSANVTIDLNVALQVSAGDANGDNLFFFENVTGSGFGDNIKGNYQSNRLVGGIGADTLNGFTGSDYLTGGADADTFRFTGLSFGADTILDWQDGSDHISIAPELESSFAGLTFTGNGTNSVIVRGFNGTGSAITVNAAAPFTLDASDFVFV